MYEHVFRIVADADRSSPDLQRQMVRMFPGDKVVDVQVALLVDGNQPAFVRRERDILSPVHLRPRIDALAVQVPLADGLRLIEGPSDERLTVGRPEAAAHRLIEPVENPQTLACLRPTVSTRPSSFSIVVLRVSTYIRVPKLGSMIETTTDKKPTVGRPRNIAHTVFVVPM